MRHLHLALLLLLPAVSAPAMADDQYAGGFLTSYANRALSRAMESPAAPEGEGVKVGRDVTKYVSAPQLGGWLIGRYTYTDQRGKHDGDGFNAHQVRLFVSGTVLRDFKYRFQVEFRGTPALRDYTIEWARWSQLGVKVGQFKRGFTFDSPTNPWNVGLCTYSQMANKLAGYGDYCGEPSMNGRDQGLQLQGDLLPMPGGHALLHYEGAVMNGNGQNRADNNGKKDWIGSLQVQPLSGLRVGLFGWRGTYRDGSVTVGRNRWALGATYEKRGWSARAEYAHNTGHRISDFDAESGAWRGRGRADGWYALLGVPVTRWLKPYVRYDAWREQATWGSMRTVYSVCPNFQLHRNLCFQLQYNRVHDRANHANPHYNEFMAEAYIRF